MAWNPVKREGPPEVRGIHPKHANRLEVVINLSEHPPDEWVRHVVGSYKENTLWQLTQFPLPEVTGKRLIIAPLDGELEDWVGSIDQRMEQANEFYESQVLPSVHAQEEAEKQAHRSAEERLKDARRRASEL